MSKFSPLKFPNSREGTIGSLLDLVFGPMVQEQPAGYEKAWSDCAHGIRSEVRDEVSKLLQEYWGWRNAFFHPGEPMRHLIMLEPRSMIEVEFFMDLEDRFQSQLSDEMFANCPSMTFEEFLRELQSRLEGKLVTQHPT